MTKSTTTTTTSSKSSNKTSNNDDTNKSSIIIWFVLPVVFSIIIGLGWWSSLLVPSSVPVQDWESNVLHQGSMYRSKVVTTTTTTNNDTTTTTTTTATLDGVVILITGATSGIGLGLTKWSYRHGATIIAMGRSLSKLNAVQKELEFENEHDASSSSLSSQRRFFPIVADFVDLQSVSDAVDRMNRGEYDDTSTSPSVFPFPDHIDILVNNAGMHLGFEPLVDPTYQPVSQQNYELVFQVNYLSHFLLTEKLLLSSLLSKSKSPRIVQVSSSFHFAVDGTDLDPRQESDGSVINTDGSSDTTIMDPIASLPGGSYGFFFYRTQRQYSNSKLAQILHARYMQRQQQQQQSQQQPTVSFRSACPGWVGTSIVQHALISGSSDQIIDENWQARAFRSVAFSSNGFGISSILLSMFDESTVAGDYYSNTHMVQFAGLLDHILSSWLHPSWTYRWLPIRDMIMTIGAFSMLPSQHIFPSVGSIQSSHASYDEDLQNRFYNWSLRAINKWL